MIEDQSIAELKAKVQLASMLIQMLRQDNDPQAGKAIKELQRQQRIINAVLVQKIKDKRAARGEPEPPPVVIGMKTLHIKGRALRR